MNLTINYLPLYFSSLNVKQYLGVLSNDLIKEGIKKSTETRFYLQNINLKKIFVIEQSQFTMMSQEFTMTAKKRISIKPFFDVYEARQQDEARNNYFAQVYSLSNFQNEKIKQSLEYNQAIFTDQFSFSSFNLLKIRKLEQSESVSVHFVEKYDKTLEEYLKSRKKGRISEEMCLMIMQDVLKGLAAILQNGFRPVSIRTDNIVRCFSKNPQQRQDIWKIRNVVFSSSFCFEHQNFLTYEQNYSPPQIYIRRNSRHHEFEESEEYINGLLVWSLGIIFAKMLGVEGKLDSKRKLSSFKDREFDFFDTQYLKKEYSEEFLKMISSMLHFDNKKRLKLKDLFHLPLFSPELSLTIKKQPTHVQVFRQVVEDMKVVPCSLFQFLGLC